MQEKVIKIVAENLGFEIEEVSLDSSLQDLGMDNLDKIEILLCLEEEFGLEIPDGIADNFKQVRDIVDFIKGATN